MPQNKPKAAQPAESAAQTPPPEQDQPAAALRQGGLKARTWWLLLGAMILGILASSLYVRRGGYLDSEADMYLVDHLGGRPFLSRVMCPHSLDATAYQARELSHFFEDIDAHLLYWSYLAGFAHFYSLVTFAMLILISGLHWHFGTHRLRLDRTSLLLLTALFWTHPNVYLGGVYIRDAKIAASLFVYAGMLALLMRMLRLGEAGDAQLVEPPRARRMAVLYFLLALSACFSDRQGFFMVLLLASAAMVWAAGLKSREMLQAGVAGGLACIVHTAYNLWLGPVLVRKLSGFEVSLGYQKFEKSDLGSGLWAHVKDAASVSCDTASFGMGDLPASLFCLLVVGLLVALFFLQARVETRADGRARKHPGLLVVLTLLYFIFGVIVMYTLMIARHPPVAFEDVRRIGYYGLPTAVLWLMIVTVLLKLLWDRFGFARSAVVLVLGVLLLFNVESLFFHYTISRRGTTNGYIQAAPYLLDELRRLRLEPPHKETSEKFDVVKSSQLADPPNMLRNPMLDMNQDQPINVDLYLKTSRYLNFLKSRKYHEFYTAW